MADRGWYIKRWGVMDWLYMPYLIVPCLKVRWACSHGRPNVVFPMGLSELNCGLLFEPMGGFTWCCPPSPTSVTVGLFDSKWWVRSSICFSMPDIFACKSSYWHLYWVTSLSSSPILEWVLFRESAAHQWFISRHCCFRHSERSSLVIAATVGGTWKFCGLSATNYFFAWGPRLEPDTTDFRLSPTVLDLTAIIALIDKGLGKLWGEVCAYNVIVFTARCPGELWADK